ncbi:MAG: peroxiredoxin [Actinobacteria bacterium]|nr:MAG: peroxiredoxin [Actinomycetota bacterium]
MLDPGTRAPPFTLPDQDGVLVTSESLRGGWVLLWWYPKAGTLGCTIEGQELRDRAHDFSAADCTVVGISFDTPAENKAWSEAQGFGFTLLSDVDHSVGRVYGAERELDDQYAAFPLRVSYLIDPEGTIRKTFAVSGVADHAAAVLDALAELRRS